MKSKLKCPLAVLFFATVGGCELQDAGSAALAEDETPVLDKANQEAIELSRQYPLKTPGRRAWYSEARSKCRAEVERVELGFDPLSREESNCFAEWRVGDGAPFNWKEPGEWLPEERHEWLRRIGWISAGDPKFILNKNQD